MLVVGALLCSKCNRSRRPGVVQCPYCHPPALPIEAMTERDAPGMRDYRDAMGTGTCDSARERAMRNRITDLEALLRVSPPPSNDNSAVMQAIGELSEKVAALYALGEHPAQRLAKGIPPHSAWCGFRRTAILPGGTAEIHAALHAYLKPCALELQADDRGAQVQLENTRIGVVSYNIGCNGGPLFDGRVMPWNCSEWASPSVPVVMVAHNPSPRTVVVWGTVYGESSIDNPHARENWGDILGRRDGY